jgi:hypothetical protein
LEIEGLCELCKDYGKLCKSHVLPDMAYEDVIDFTSHPRMVVVRDVEKGRVSDKTRQTGYQERLLCEECENQFSRYETYASNWLLSAKLPPPKEPRELLYVHKVDDYAKLKLFLMSLLWRVSVAKGEFFRCVKLGRHEEELRQMLHAQNPGEPDEYGCLITQLLPENEIPVERFLAMPAMARVDGHNGCLLAFRGFAFQYYVSRHRIPEGVRRAFLNRSGEIIIARAHPGQIPPLRDLWNRCVRAIRRESHD